MNLLCSIEHLHWKEEKYREGKKIEALAQNKLVLNKVEPIVSRMLQTTILTGFYIAGNAIFHEPSQAHDTCTVPA